MANENSITVNKTSYSTTKPSNVATKYPTDAQPAYGVQVITEAQPAYGVPFISEAQPKYGVPYVGPSITGTTGTSTTRTDLDITFSQIDQNISTLKKAISTMKTAWDGETKKNIATINSSWVGPDCEEYTTKLSRMDGKVQNTISALELLRSTYEKARDMVSSNQKSTISSISNLGE